MSGYSSIRKVLTAMLTLAVLLWAEAGLALVAGDRVSACRTMMMHAPASMTAASDDADMPDSEETPCCRSDSAPTPISAENHRPCCSVSNDAERPLAFLVSSERTAPHPPDTAAATAGSVVPSPAHCFGEMRSADAPRFVKPILELKTDLKI